MTRPDPATLLADLREENRQLQTLLASLSDLDWDRPTPAQGWLVRHQVSHLAWTDQLLLSALEDNLETFEEQRRLLVNDPEAVDRAAAENAVRPPAELLNTWGKGARRVIEALAAIPADGRIPWIGPPMGVAMMASARIMETWAHGQDIRDTIGQPPIVSARLRHIAHLAVAARDYSFHTRGQPSPSEPFRVEIVHGNDLWTWGPPEAAQCVRGNSADFALLATRRRNRDDCAVTAMGAEADHWLDIVQAYAGPAGTGRSATQAAGKPLQAS